MRCAFGQSKPSLELALRMVDAPPRNRAGEAPNGTNYSRAGFEPLKVTAIKELPMGTNSKLHVQFSDRFWYDADNEGNTYADTVNGGVETGQRVTGDILADLKHA